MSESRQGQSETSGGRVMQCPECGRVASVPEWCARPICVHAWDGNVPEVWDGDNDDGEGRPIEMAPHEPYRTPGPNTWTEMVPYVTGTRAVCAGRPMRVQYEPVRQTPPRGQSDRCTCDPDADGTTDLFCPVHSVSFPLTNTIEDEERASWADREPDDPPS